MLCGAVVCAVCVGEGGGRVHTYTHDVKETNEPTTNKPSVHRRAGTGDHRARVAQHLIRAE